MKRSIKIIIILLLILVSYIGIHRIVYSSEYAKIKTLTDDIFITKNELADIQARVDNNKVQVDKNKTDNPIIEKYGSNQFKDEYEKSKQDLINLKSKYQKQQAELSYLKQKTSILNLIK